MADFKCSDDVLSDLRIQLMHIGYSGTVETKMLDEGAKVIVKEWKKSIKKYNHIRTGQMIESVGSWRKNIHSLREIYPQGKDDKGVRNAEKAFIAHYGKSGQIGTRFVDDAESNGEPEAVLRMQEVFDEYLKEKGL